MPRWGRVKEEVSGLFLVVVSLVGVVVSLVASLKIQKYFASMPPNDDRVVDLTKYQGELSVLNVEPLLLLLETTITTLLESIEAQDMDNDDISVYTGTMGLAWTYLILSRNSEKDRYLNKAKNLIDRANGHNSRSKSSVSFFSSPAIGLHTLAALTYHSLGDPKTRDYHIAELLKLEPKPGDGSSSELLNGKAGYLFALDLINSTTPIQGYDQCVQRQVDLIIQEGLQGYIGDWPLMWQWHGTSYLGAGHGVAGILMMLLRHPEHLEAGFATRNDQRVSSYRELVEETVVRMTTLKSLPTRIETDSARLPSGNWKSSLEAPSTRDKLVHWCHGAPGIIPMLIEAIKAFPNHHQDLLEATIDEAAHLVSQRGVLRKGLGLCHGVGGNGYVLLRAYLATGRAEYLQESLRFAKIIGLWTRDERFRSAFNQPDHPYSLFEGIAGAVVFLSNLKAVLNASSVLTLTLSPL